MPATDAETELYYKKRRAFYGSIKCPLRGLQFETPDLDPRQLDPRVLTAQVENFKLQGSCHRLEPQNRALALISQNTFHTLARLAPGGEAGLRAQSTDPAFVMPPQILTCLQGRHHVEAAKEYVHPDDKWWVVDLYADSKREHPHISDS